MPPRKPDSDWWRYQKRPVQGQVELRRVLAQREAERPKSTREQANAILARPGAVSSTGMLNPRYLNPGELQIIAQARAEAELAAGPKLQQRVVSPGGAAANLGKGAVETAQFGLDLATGRRGPVFKPGGKTPGELLSKPLEAIHEEVIQPSLGGIQQSFVNLQRLIRGQGMEPPRTPEELRELWATTKRPWGVTAVAENLPWLLVPSGTQAKAALGEEAALRAGLQKALLEKGAGLLEPIVQAERIMGEAAGLALKAATRATTKGLVRVPVRPVQEAGLRLVGARGVAGGAERIPDSIAKIIRHEPPRPGGRFVHVKVGNETISVRTRGSVDGKTPSDFGDTFPVEEIRVSQIKAKALEKAGVEYPAPTKPVPVTPKRQQVARGRMPPIRQVEAAGDVQRWIDSGNTRPVAETLAQLDSMGLIVRVEGHSKPGGIIPFSVRFKDGTFATNATSLKAKLQAEVAGGVKPISGEVPPSAAQAVEAQAAPPAAQAGDRNALRARVRQLERAISDGESRLRSRLSGTGERLPQNQLDAVQRSVDASKAELGQIRARLAARAAPSPRPGASTAQLQEYSKDYLAYIRGRGAKPVPPPGVDAGWLGRLERGLDQFREPAAPAQAAEKAAPAPGRTPRVRRTPPPQVGAPGAAPVEAAGIAPPAPAATLPKQTAAEAKAQLEVTQREVEEALQPPKQRVPGGPRAVPLEPRPKPLAAPRVEPGVGPPGGRLPSGREVGGPGRGQPPPPRDPYGMLKASLEPEREPLIGRLRTALPQELYDRNFPLKELEAATGIPTRKAAQVVPGAMAAGEDVVRRFYAPIVKTVEKDLKFLERYMVLMRGSDILARNPHARLPGGIANEGERQIALAALKKDIGAERFAQIEQAASDLWRVNDEQVLRPWLDEGIISADMYREMKATHPHYIPFMRDDFAEVITNSFSARPEANLSTTGIKRMGLEGSERALSNPLLRLLQQPIKAKQIIFRNQAAKSIVRALEEQQRLTGEELVRYIDPKKEMNIVQRVTGEAIPRVKKGEISQNWETISFFENGVKNRVEVPSIYGRVAKGLEAEPDNIFLKAARFFNAPLRLGATTFNPWFTPTNVIRDAMSAMFREKLFPFGPDYMAGLWAAIRKNADFSEAAQAGALIGGLIDDMSRARILKNPLGGITVRNPWEAVTFIPRVIEEMNIIVERGVRIATFKKLRAEGLDVLEAAVRSRDATVDFAKSGHAMRVINQVLPFTNAAVQGQANIIRTIRDHPARSAAFAAMFAGVAITVRVNNMRFETSELIPDYEYTRNWVVQFGEGTRADGTKYPIYAKIPKGEIAAIFTFVPEALFHLARKSEDRSAVELLLSSGYEVTRAVSPIEIGGATGLLPPGLETGVALQTGVDPFTGAPLIPERLRGLPPEQQFTEQTSQTAIQIGKLFKVSPMLVDFALNDVAAGAGQTVNWLASMGLEALGVDIEAFGSGDPDADLRPTGLERLTKERTPGISRFIGTRDTQLVRRGYDNLVDAVVDTNRAIGNFPDVSRLGIKFGQVQGTIGNMELTPQQRARYQELAGQLAIEGLTRLQFSVGYQRAADVAKEAVIREVFNVAREKARALMRRDVLPPAVTPQRTAPGRLRPPSGEQAPGRLGGTNRLRRGTPVTPTPEPVGAR